MGPPERVVIELARAVGATTFIETGTYRGDTAAWAARHFADVVTIEASPELHALASRRFATSRVRFVLGDSRRALRETLGEATGPAVVWLDAHWSGGSTHGEGRECPLLEELAILGASEHAHAILVDDARCFGAPPPAPHRADEWPDLLQTVAAIAQGGRRWVAWFEDVLIGVPVEHRERVRSFLQAEATASWQAKAARGRMLRWLKEHL